MITVTDNWKALHTEKLLPEAYVEVSYYITEPGLVDDVTSSGNVEQAYSDASQVKDFSLRNEPLFATFEGNAWVLNSRYKFLADSAPYGDVGYVSSVISNSSQLFTTNPVITLSLGSVHSVTIPGVSITFAPDRNEWAEEFKVRLYNDVTLLSETVVTGNTEAFRLVDILSFTNYDKVEVEIVKWSLPGRRARIIEIALGLKNIYTKSDLLGYEHTSQGDIVSGELPKNSVIFKLENIDGKWNPNNPSGMEQYLQERQAIVVRYGFKINGSIEWVKAGTFYMSEWDTPSNGLEATFTARDILEFLGEAYTGTRNDTLTNIATAVFTQANIASSFYEIDSSLDSLSVNFSADTSVYTLGEVLQMCANAAECVLYQDHVGVLHIEPLVSTLTDYEISQFNSYSHPEFSLSKELKSVSINEGLGSSTNTTVGEVLTVDNPIITVAGMANSVAEWIRDTLKDRKTVSGDFRPDPRLEVFDKITVVSKYATNTVYITEIKYTFGGTFKANYKGRIAT